MTRHPDSIPLSIVVACRTPWPALQCALDALYQQAVAAGAEIIVAMSDRGVIAPEAARLYPAVRWLRGAPDDSVFRLRALAIPECRGDIVALTEDHCRVAPDWCSAILDAHAQHPEAGAIGGAVENDATASMADWAAFFVVNGVFMRPIRNGASDRISLQANVSYKRRALPDSYPPYGLVQSMFHCELAARGEKLMATDRMLVHHVQEMTLRGHSRMHFHNARATAAFFRSAAPGSRWLAAYLLLFPRMTLSTVSAVLAKRRHLRELAMGFPLIIWLAGCHAAGELVGHFRGPGRSAQHVG